MKKAFTLIELFVSMTILSFIVIGIFAVFNASDMSWNQQNTFIALQQQARHAIDVMAREIRQSDSSTITIDVAGDGITFSIPASSQSISYSLNGTQIDREHPPGTQKTVAHDIGALQFTLTGDTVTIAVTATRMDNRARTFSFALAEKVFLRND